ncbi:MAG: three-Cys-motif partner protein TcmP [Phormidesmis sp. CAN_BIN44]|nr:three-Cys-motif partner protein TcmP [Phormidesmis sp. CAN_BIN44]
MVKHSFGGDWTASKLRCLSKYLDAYTRIVSKQNFNEYMYIDAFAGTGWLTLKQNENPDHQLNVQGLIFSPLEPYQEFSAEGSKDQLDGSARIALKVNPVFTQYFFVEKDKKRFYELQKLKADYPERKIVFENSDANIFIQQICREYKWQKDGVRAVLFLDPYGMNVSWKTVEMIAETEAIDLWYLFPLGVALNRLLKNNGKISDTHRSKIDTVLGTPDWYDVFYQTCIDSNIFGSESSTKKVVDFESISQYLIQRFQSKFAGVASNPRMLVNSKNNPLYLLCFASANPRGSTTAIKIAQDILTKEGNE